MKITVWIYLNKSVVNSLDDELVQSRNGDNGLVSINFDTEEEAIKFANSPDVNKVDAGALRITYGDVETELDIK